MIGIPAVWEHLPTMFGGCFRAGHAAEVKQQIVDRAMNASGIRATARVLHVSPTTVIKELKKGTCAAPGEAGALSVLAS